MTLRVTAIIAAALTASLAAQQPVFRTATDLVVVDVSVRQSGRAVTDLTEADFAVSDNGVAQTIVDVSRETLPIDVDLIVDTSGSMDGSRFAALTRGLDAVRSQLRQGDRARVLTFNQKMRDAGLLTRDRDLSEVLGATSGSTAFYDALVAGLIVPLEPNRRRMAIVFTDGIDVLSLLTSDEALDVALRCGVTVFSVVLPENTPIRTASGTFLASAVGEDLLRRLSANTGGAFATILNDAELGTSFVRALGDFRTSYVVRYIATGVPKSGWHDLNVRVTKTGRYDTRARKGYFGD